jgi:hypothetical protein
MEDSVTFDVPSFSSLYFFTSLDLGPVQMASPRVFTISGDTSTAGGDSPYAGSAEWIPYGTARYWDVWVLTVVNIDQLFDCFLVIVLPVYTAPVVCT